VGPVGSVVVAVVSGRNDGKRVRRRLVWSTVGCCGDREERDKEGAGCVSSGAGSDTGLGRYCDGRLGVAADWVITGCAEVWEWGCCVGVAEDDDAGVLGIWLLESRGEVVGRVERGSFDRDCIIAMRW
jgi:hypothetical protein